jgi:hypothetical protein
MATATVEVKAAQTLPVAVRALLSRHVAELLFWAVVALYLVPVWAFPYLPTQDGPEHLSSALALKDYGTAGTRYDDFFSIRFGPLPNWLAHLLLAGLMFLVPPLLAEKLLVTFYVVSFAASARYFLTALGGAGRPLAAAALLFVFGRCFWLGFYNFCLSLVLFWLILGYVVRRRENFGPRQALVLGLLFLLAYFSHLFGFLLAAGGAGWLAITARPRPLRRLAWVGLAALPAVGLGIWFLAGNGFFVSRAAGRLGEAPLAWLSGEGGLERLGLELLSIQWQIFEPQAGGYLAVGLGLWLFLAALALLTLGQGRDQTRPPVWPVATLGLLLFLLYFLVPDHLGADPHSTEHGGFLKSRLALLPPLLWLACFPMPRLLAARRLLGGALALLLCLNLALVLGYCQRANRDLAEYTAGIGSVGPGRVIFALTPDDQPRPVADPLLHAAGYYVLATGGVNLENYQPATNHFPLLFRPGIARGCGDFADYPNAAAVDVVLDWNSSLAAGVPLAYREVFHQGRMRVFASSP